MRAQSQRRTALFAASANSSLKGSANSSLNGFKIVAALLAAKANPNLYDPTV
jgi:hypothetical protein